MDPRMEDSRSAGRSLAETDLQAKLRDVRWIGGGSGAGKSTVACRLSERYSLRLYGTDEMHSDHVSRTDPAEMPLVQAFRAMDMASSGRQRDDAELVLQPHFRAPESGGVFQEAREPSPVVAAPGRALVAPPPARPDEGVVGRS